MSGADGMPQRPGEHARTCELERMAQGLIAYSQQQPCGPDTPVGFVRAPKSGIGHDIGIFVKSLHLCLVGGGFEGWRGWARRFDTSPLQLVILPPVADVAQQMVAAPLTVFRPWHWLHDDQQPNQSLNLDELFHLSACHRHLLKHNASWLEKIAREPNFPKTRELRAQMPFRAWEVVDSYKQTPFGTEIEVPRMFASMGRFWWSQMVTKYMLRIQRPLKERLARHPAWQSASSGSGEHDRYLTSTGRFAFNSRAFAFSYPCMNPVESSRHVRSDSSSRNLSRHLDEAPFDVGLYVRLGDACGPRQPKQRWCLTSLNEAMKQLDTLSGGASAPKSVFIATDSLEVIQQAKATASTSTTSFHFLDLDRHKKDASESAAKRGSQSSKLELLLETLLEVILLGHSRIIAGSMTGTIPRLALQLQYVPSDEYFSFDGVRWCVSARCSISSKVPAAFHFGVLGEWWQFPHGALVPHGSKVMRGWPSSLNAIDALQRFEWPRAPPLTQTWLGAIISASSERYRKVASLVESCGFTALHVPAAVPEDYATEQAMSLVRHQHPNSRGSL